jgi:undecaprenyl-diphosphatase
MNLRHLAVSSSIFFTCCGALAGSGGILGIDHRLGYDDSSLWSSEKLKAVEYGSALLVVGAALYEGSESRLGKTLWRSFDSMVTADVAAAAGKALIRRQRPIDGNDPDAFFRSGGDTSFPRSLGGRRISAIPSLAISHPAPVGRW